MGIKFLNYFSVGPEAFRKESNLIRNCIVLGEKMLKILQVSRTGVLIPDDPE